MTKTNDKSAAPPSPEDIAALARLAGLPIDAEVAARIVAAIGPGLTGFAPLAGTLPFDLEPASFTRVQGGGQS
jgi:hypothetical protein